MSSTPPPPASPSTPRPPELTSSMVHQVEHLEADLRDTNRLITGIEEAINNRFPQIPLWRRVLNGAMAVGLISLLVTHYMDVRGERDNLSRSVDRLQAQVTSDQNLKSDLAASSRLLGEYRALQSYALLQGKLSQDEIGRYVQGGEALASGAPRRTLWITYPADRVSIQDGSIVRGSATITSNTHIKIVSGTCWIQDCSTNLPKEERTIWILTRAITTNRLYPQGRWDEQAGPAQVNSSGDWVSPAVFVGSTPVGNTLLIHAVLTTHEAEEVFKEYLRKGEETNKYDGLRQSDLPVGAEIVDTVQVVRK